MKCHRCGRELDLGAVFCGNCGQAVSVGQAEAAEDDTPEQLPSVETQERTKISDPAAANQPYAESQASKTAPGKMATWAVVLGAVGLPSVVVVIGVPLCLAAIVMGARTYKTYPVRATAAIVLGLCGLVLFGLLLPAAIREASKG